MLCHMLIAALRIAQRLTTQCLTQICRLAVQQVADSIIPGESPEPTTPSPSPAPVTPPRQDNNCSASQSLITQLNAIVPATAEVSVSYFESEGDGIGYFRHVVSGCNPETSPLCSGSTFNGERGMWEVSAALP